MPLRIPRIQFLLCSYLDSSSTLPFAGHLTRPSRAAAAPATPYFSPPICFSFSTTSRAAVGRLARLRRMNLAQKAKRDWLFSKGIDYRDAPPPAQTLEEAKRRVKMRLRPGFKPEPFEEEQPKKKITTNYLGGERPFFRNEHFQSQPVLSEEARELIYQEVTEKALPIKVVSAKYGVDYRRVAAVVRMKTIEKEWEKNNKKLATVYSRAVLGMLPCNDLLGTRPFHEPVNDIHVLSRTQQQIFLPTAESRHFTRADAAKVFGEKVLPADKRVPVPELVEMRRNVLVRGLSPKQAHAMFVDATREDEFNLEESLRKAAKRAADRIDKVVTDRFEFRIERVSVESVGKNGRARGGVGWRYGFPFEDRKRGQVKIPTKVE